jgi:quinol monooxygenase YgiN
MSKFVQFVEFCTDSIDEVRELAAEWEQATLETKTALSSVIVQDRDARDWYVAIVTFPSYEAAMKNSELPATQLFATKMKELCKENSPKFCNLDVINESEWPSQPTAY